MILFTMESVYSIVISLRVSFSDFGIEKLVLNVFTFDIKKS